MVLHGDGSMNTWINNGLLPFENYYIDGRNNILGAQLPPDTKHPYQHALNEQFDLVFSNPPFSITMSADEKSEIENAFSGMLNLSENLFIERWYQLLKEGGRFCCILPESVLDTKTNMKVRTFLLMHFKIIAAISLPYDAFKPFTSTKTCILYAEKRTAGQVGAIKNEFDSIVASKKGDITQCLLQAFLNLNLADEKVFMAEPTSIGYKRRKGLPDLKTPNELYAEGIETNISTVLYHFQHRESMKADATWNRQ